VAVIRFKTHARFPIAKVVMLAVVLVVLLLIVGGGALALLEPRPTLKHFELPVSNDRFSH
jgi:hypothetical protein